MNELLIEPEALIDEVTRYLAAVEAFRAADCEPTWRPELAVPSLAREPARETAPLETSAH